MKLKRLTAIIALLLCFSLFPAVAGAASAPSFTMNLTKQKQSVGQMFTVTVEGSGLTDMYAFELTFNYDSTRLKLLGAKSDIKGFSIKPITGKNEIVFAHTKTGAIAGENGELTLCTLTFEALAEGEASIELTAAKLVDSKLKATMPAAAFQLTSSIGKQAERPHFIDMDNHWAKANVERAIDLGIVNGYTDGTFKPGRSITRAEFTAMLVRSLGIQASESGAAAFTDSAKIPSWARPYAHTAAVHGYVKGYEDGSFRAELPITRAEMTVILTRVLGLTIDTNQRTTFADRDQIPAWAEPAIAAGVEISLVQGRGGNRFAPNAQATRAEAVTLMLNMLDKRVVEADAS
ncbi:S-layer homology domain-containing protein [Paenibacillus sp. PL91]|uniref:S-layer homology domain-containing protein n=1 Tax=Paenibacillus sp. PL91 TaxID=2729538 RepID=UPI00145E00BE|nr:S-layer homology domain-containing protein [Paenibacillus sp. PL91]MBC9198763.1 S-layer homology domain-containing protein [Paenibacillus sp. PL91]